MNSYFLLVFRSCPDIHYEGIHIRNTRKIIAVWMSMPDTTKPMILIIENEEEIRRVYTDMLSCTGAYLLEAGNPYEAFDCLRTHSITLILTDLYMPGGGLDYLATLRRETGTCPIIVVTGLSGGDTIRQATLLAGATVFLEKPFRARQFREIVNGFLFSRPIAN